MKKIIEKLRNVDWFGVFCVILLGMACILLLILLGCLAILTIHEVHNVLINLG